MIKKLVRLYLINIFALWVVSSLVGGFHLFEGLKSLLMVGAGFSFLHLLVGPIVKMILGPINFLTLGLIGLVVDSGLLYLLTVYFPQVSVTPWDFAGINISGITIQPISFNFWLSLVVSAAVINLVRGILSFLAE